MYRLYDTLATEHASAKCITVKTNNDYPYMYLSGHQLFVQWYWLQNVDRLLLFHDVGTGKTLTAMNIASKYKSVYIIGNTKDNIKNDIIRHVLLNVATPEDINIMNSYLKDNNTYDYKLYQQRLFRKINFKFYGYQEFVNHLFNNKYPENVTYEELHELVTKNQLPLTGIKFQKDSLIIVDEAHNLYNSVSMNAYGKSIKLICDIYKCKLLLLTATPLNNNVREVYSLASLLIKDYDNDKMLYDPVDYIKKNVKVSRVKTLNKDYPEIRYIGSKNIDDYFCNTVDIEIEDKHFEDYKKKIEQYKYKDYMLTYFGISKNVTQQQEFDITDSILDKLKFELVNTDTFISGKGSQGITTPSKLNYLKTFVNGKQFIYTKYVATQLKQISNALIEGGYIEYTSNPTSTTRCNICNELITKHKSTTDHTFEAKRYAIISGNTVEHDREHIKTVFNSYTNANGKYIKCIIGSQVLEESTELKAVNNIYIINIPNNISTLKQIIGRVARRNSHSQLSGDLNYVNVHVLCAVFTKKQKKELSNDNILSPDQSYLLKNSIEYKDIEYFENVFEEINIENEDNYINEEELYYNPVIHKPYADRILAYLHQLFEEYKALSEDAAINLIHNKCINTLMVVYTEDFIRYLFREYTKKNGLTPINNIYSNIKTKRTHFLEDKRDINISLKSLLETKTQSYMNTFGILYKDLKSLTVLDLKSIYEHIVPLFNNTTGGIVHYNKVFNSVDLEVSKPVSKLITSIKTEYTERSPYNHVAIINTDMSLLIQDTKNERSTGINCNYVRVSIIDSIIESINLKQSDYKYIIKLTNDSTGRNTKCNILLAILLYMHINDDEYYYVKRVE